MEDLYLSRSLCYHEDDYIPGPRDSGGGITRGTRLQCEVLPAVRGIAERGNVITG